MIADQGHAQDATVQEVDSRDGLVVVDQQDESYMMSVCGGNVNDVEVWAGVRAEDRAEVVVVVGVVNGVQDVVESVHHQHLHHHHHRHRHQRLRHLHHHRRRQVRGVDQQAIHEALQVAAQLQNARAVPTQK